MITLNEKVKNKKILFLSVKFFDYEKLISDKLTSMGAEVIYYDERPSNSKWAKGIIRINRDFLKRKITRYYKDILKNIKDQKIDYFLLIKGEVAPKFFIKKLRTMNPNIVMIYYNFDSFANNPNAIKIISFFDRKFTFDHEDALTYDLDFRPLFFIDDYAKIYNENKHFKYDLTFIGTTHTDRYLISEQLASWCKLNHLRSYAFYFSHSRLVFLYQYLFDATFKNFSYKKLKFKSLKHNQIIELYKESKIILDINHPHQKGLTMRTFEALGAGRKLITTNAEIIKYPFYNVQNVLIIDRNDIKIDSKQFFETDFEIIDNALYKKMSIDGWLHCLFVESETSFWYNYLNTNK